MLIIKIRELRIHSEMGRSSTRIWKKTTTLKYTLKNGVRYVKDRQKKPHSWCFYSTCSASNVKFIFYNTLMSRFHLRYPSTVCFWDRRSFRQLLDDHPGDGVPAGGGVAVWVVTARAHPDAHVHGPGSDALAQTFHWAQKKTQQKCNGAVGTIECKS